MADARPPLTALLEWEDGLRFAGHCGKSSLLLDGEGEAGPSPMQALALSLGACMGTDVVSILRKGRHPLHGLKAELSGRRANGQPARFIAISLRYEIVGDVPAEAIERAIELSRDKYCSVWQSMRDDIEFEITYAVVPA
jgi:putative redox protein